MSSKATFHGDLEVKQNLTGPTITAINQSVTDVDTKLSGDITNLDTKLSGDITSLDTKLTGELSVEKTRIQKLEDFFVVDDATQTITLKNYRVVIEGDLEQGALTAVADGSFGNPIDQKSSITFDSNNAPSTLTYNSQNYEYNFTSVNGPYVDEADVLSKIQAVDSQVQAIDVFVLVTDLGTSSDVELALVSGASGFKAFVLN